MKETLHNARGLDQTRIRRAFKWVITFRDFPAGSWQTVDGDSMMTEALTLFTKGRAEFYLDDVRREDRVAGILSAEHERVGVGGTFTIRYVEPTTRLCVPSGINRGKLPKVKKIQLKSGDKLQLQSGQKILVCLGLVEVGEDAKTFKAERSFEIESTAVELTALEDSILLEFE